MALLLALVALVVLDATVALLWLGAQQQARRSGEALDLVHVALAADGQLARTYATWDSLTFDTLAVGGVAARSPESWGHGVTAEAAVTRRSAALFEIMSRAERRDGTGAIRAQRAVGLLVRRSRDSGALSPVHRIRGHAWRLLE